MTQRVTRGRKGRTVRDRALPFMPFYDVLCPLVPENEKRAERAEKIGQGDRENVIKQKKG